MNTLYLKNVTRVPSSYNGIEVIGVGFDSWYAGNYNTVKSASFYKIKQEIIAFTNNALGRITRVNEWEWHHVVETGHMASILSRGANLRDIEYFQMPTILIHKNEHKFYSQNFNNNAFRELSAIPKASKKQFSLLSSSENGDHHQILKRIENLQMMYNLMYSKNPALKTIAANVFETHKSLLF